MRTKFKDIEWDLADSAGNISTWERVQIAVLMDIRDELHRLNNVIQCHNFIAVPGKLDRIIRNTTKRRKRTVTAKPPALRVVR